MGLLWNWTRTHDMSAMIRYLDHWATAAPLPIRCGHNAYPFHLCDTRFQLPQRGQGPVSIETESLKYNDTGLIRGPVNGENKYPSDPLINIHCEEQD
ncbi:hypothetical protein TNCV_3424491 [Trichonephila clavipes]|nr:hypothetical protein TNCV_3424491 [Trichonephila clavipes]